MFVSHTGIASGGVAPLHYYQQGGVSIVHRYAGTSFAHVGIKLMYVFTLMSKRDINIFGKRFGASVSIKIAHSVLCLGHCLYGPAS